ncbi:MAG: LysR substrate-binding domain-containing protein, partial [Polynucleobacter victoriensis]
ELATFPYYSWHHAVIVPKGHPLEKLQKISLEDLAEHPIVTYHEGFTGRQIIDETFLKANITPDIVMSALDADVIKTYVELGLGIGIIASMAYQKDRDTQLTLLESSTCLAITPHGLRFAKVITYVVTPISSLNSVLKS